MRFQKYRDSCAQGLNLTRPYSSQGFAGLTKTTSNRGMKYSCGVAINPAAMQAFWVPSF